MARPEGETRKERRLQRIIGTGVVVLFLLLGVIVIQGVVQYRSQEDHHNASVAQQAEIITKDKETITLLKEHSVTFAQQQKAAAQQTQYDADVLAAAEAVAENTAVICTALHLTCEPLPGVPATTTTTTAK